MSVNRFLMIARLGISDVKRLAEAVNKQPPLSMKWIVKMNISKKSYMQIRNGLHISQMVMTLPTIK